jgi:hypothetical protein
MTVVHGRGLVGCHPLTCAPGAHPGSVAQRDWWKSAVVYKVYPRSFADSDGEGRHASCHRPRSRDW